MSWRVHGAGAATAEAQGALAPLRLLLVEDDPLDRDIVQRLLTRSGIAFELDHVDGVAAAARALETPYDCALFDLDLPDGSGLDLLRRLRASGCETTPVIVLTGHDEPELATACLSAGAQDYLIKGSFERDALLRAIRYARERWRLRLELLEKSAALERSNVELERFAQVASHDLQEPLRSLRVLAGRLTERCAGQLDERGQEYVRRMAGAADRMQQLVRDLLELSRLRIDPIELRPCDLDAVLERVLADHAATIEETGAAVSAGPLGRAQAEPGALARVLGNLLANALRYRHPERPPRVRFEARALGSGEADAAGLRTREPRVELAVSDEGIGFSPDEAEQLFRPFNRLGDRQAQEGTGIGLAVCKAIVERHGGTIHAEGRPDQGARFSFTLRASGARQGGRQAP